MQGLLSSYYLSYSPCVLQANGVTVERLERDVGALTDEQRLSAVMADAPELAALLGELQGSLAEVRSHVGPVLREVGPLTC